MGKSLFPYLAKMYKMSAFHAKMSQCVHHFHTTCSESVLSLTQQSSQSECSWYSRDKGNPKLHSVDNNMDPSHIPPELQGLTQIEEMLISTVMPMMSMYHPPFGQYGYSGHVINLLQHISRFTSRLPTPL